MNASISCDHRVVDGWDAASYIQTLKRYLETPVLLFAPYRCQFGCGAIGVVGSGGGEV